MITNKYSNIYQLIVKKAQDRGLQKTALGYYTERHHIVPRSLGGSDDTSNLVLLTAKEHFVCHHLLTKFTIGYDKQLMDHAYGFMCQTSQHGGTRRLGTYQNSTLFSQKRIRATVRSPEWRSKISAANKGKKRTPEQNAANSARLTGRKLSESHRANVAAASKIRGISTAAREARYNTLVKQWRVIYPDGSEEIVQNIKQWCISRGANANTYQSSHERGEPVSRGTLMGFKFIKLSQ